MKTLTEKDLKYYLGTGLRMKTISKGNFSCDPNVETISEMTLSNINDLFRKRYHVISCKPCFLPLSALTEQLPDGSVPIVELAKIATGYDDIHAGETKTNDEGCFLNFNDDLVFAYCAENSFGMYNLFGSVYTVARQLQLFEYLYQHHFWLGDQSFFEQGILIDKRTIK